MSEYPGGIMQGRAFEEMCRKREASLYKPATNQMEVRERLASQAPISLEQAFGSDRPAHKTLSDMTEREVKDVLTRLAWLRVMYADAMIAHLKDRP